MGKRETQYENFFEAIVIGASAGGQNALAAILPGLPGNFKLPVIIVQHRHPSSNSYIIEALNEQCKLVVKEAEDKEQIEAGTIYVAPPDYHLLIENDCTFSLSLGEKVNYSRPSIDVLFESASEVYGPRLIGVVLTGASSDGSTGLRTIKERGGMTIVQDPRTAESAFMPNAAIKAAQVDHILPLEQICFFLADIGNYKTKSLTTEDTAGHSEKN